MSSEEKLMLNDSEIDEMEVGRCSCGLVFYSTESALDHVCLGHPFADDEWYAGDPPAGAL